jgi:Na+/H+ antiporter NhaD/arsenite permease-like protein
MNPIRWIDLGIILFTYAAIAIGQVPRLRMNRATIALTGAAALIAVRAIDEKQAFAAVDLGTVTLLFAMMVINVNLRIAGFFRLVGNRVLRLASTPRTLLALIVMASGVLSALFLNDPVCLLFTPLVVDLTLRARRNPIPYLLGLATAANIGSTATITGNPQNLIIGQASGIPYLTFLLHLGPVALIGLAICWGVIVLVFPGEFRGRLEHIDLPEPQTYPPLLIRCVLVVIGLLVAFLIGLPVASSAFVAAALLLTSRLHPRKLLALDWDLLAFFFGLFIVTGAIEVTGLSDQLFKIAAPLLHSGTAALSVATAGLSNLVSNVPAVLLFRPQIASFPNPQQAWLTLAMSSTLAGNLTLLGSVANLIVAEVAARQGVQVTFAAYLRVGVPVTILTIAVGVIWLTLFH